MKYTRKCSYKPTFLGFQILASLRNKIPSRLYPEDWRDLVTVREIAFVLYPGDYEIIRESWRKCDNSFLYGAISLYMIINEDSRELTRPRCSLSYKDQEVRLTLTLINCSQNLLVSTQGLEELYPIV